MILKPIVVSSLSTCASMVSRRESNTCFDISCLGFLVGVEGIHDYEEDAAETYTRYMHLALVSGGFTSLFKQIQYNHLPWFESSALLRMKSHTIRN